MKPINNFILAVDLTITFSVTPNNVQAQVKDPQEETKNYFLQTLKTERSMEQQSREAFQRNKTYMTDIQQLIKNKDIARDRKMAWAAQCEANRELNEQKLTEPEDLWKDMEVSRDLPEALEENAVTPYYYGIKGSAADRLPLFLYLHDSGPEGYEWAAGLISGNRLQDGPSLYFTPQIPSEGNYYRWWQVVKQFVQEKLIRQALVKGNVGANRLYVFDVSEGGCDSQRFASFYTDYWATASSMADGEPLRDAPVENYVNIGFSFLTGADDTGSYRNILTYYTQIAPGFAQLARPPDVDKRLLFVHHTNLLPGMQHHIKYDLTTPWLKNSVRNPYPKTVFWENHDMDRHRRSGLHSLQVLTSPMKGRTYYDMNIHNNVVKINIKGMECIAAEKDKHWGIEARFNHSYTNAKDGKLRTYLNSKLIDTNKPVTAIVNGKEFYRKDVKANPQDMINSCTKYFDPYKAFPVSIKISY